MVMPVIPLTPDPSELFQSVGPSKKVNIVTVCELLDKWINWQHQKVLLAITRCRTAALGGHRDQCSHCGHVAISYNSCRNRHCPRCQGNARLRWLRSEDPR